MHMLATHQLGKIFQKKALRPNKNEEKLKGLIQSSVGGVLKPHA